MEHTEHKKLHIKFGNEDPSMETLQEAADSLNVYLSGYQRVYSPYINGKYISYEFEHSGLWDNGEMACHMLAGYLMAKGVEII